MNDKTSNQTLVINLDLSLEQIASLAREARLKSISIDDLCKEAITSRPGQVLLGDGVRKYFDMRISTALWAERINTIGDLLEYDLSHLHRIPRLGIKSHSIIENFLLEKGLILVPIQKK